MLSVGLTQLAASTPELELTCSDPTPAGGVITGALSYFSSPVSAGVAPSQCWTKVPSKCCSELSTAENATCLTAKEPVSVLQPRPSPSTLSPFPEPLNGYLVALG